MKRDPENIIIYSFLFVLVVGILGAYASGAKGELSDMDKTRLDTTLGLMLGYIIGRGSKRGSNNNGTSRTNSTD